MILLVLAKGETKRPLLLALDGKHSHREPRFIALGQTDAQRQLAGPHGPGHPDSGDLPRPRRFPCICRPRLAHLKALANKRDVPYQSLLKVFLAERVAAEWRRPRVGTALSNKRLPPAKGRRAARKKASKK